MVARVLNPAAALMGRLTYARKFALIGCILVAADRDRPARLLVPAERPDRLLGQGARRRAAQLGPANTLLARLVRRPQPRGGRGRRRRAARGASPGGDAGGRAPRWRRWRRPTPRPAWRWAPARLSAQRAHGRAAGAGRARRPRPHAAFAAYEPAVTAALGPRHPGGERVEPDPRPGPRLLLRDGRARDEAAGDRRQRGPRGRPAADRLGAGGSMSQRIALAGAQGTLRSTDAAMRDGFKTAFATRPGAKRPAGRARSPPRPRRPSAVAAGVDPTGHRPRRRRRRRSAARPPARPPSASRPRRCRSSTACWPRASAAWPPRARGSWSSSSLALLLALYLFLGFFALRAAGHRRDLRPPGSAARPRRRRPARRAGRAWAAAT